MKTSPGPSSGDVRFADGRTNRLRYFMQPDGAVLNMVLRIFLRVIAQSLQAHSPGAANVNKVALHIGAVAFIHSVFVWVT